MKKITFLLSFLTLLSWHGMGQTSTLYLTTSGGSFTTEKWVSITDGPNGTGNVIWAQGNGTYGDGQGLVTDESFTVTDGVTYYINCYDRYADGWDGTTYEIRDAIGGGGLLVANNGGNSPDDGTDNDASGAWETPLDELEVSEAFSYMPPACPDPTALTATNITATTADLGWTDATGSLWDIEWGTTGFTPTGTPNITGTTTNPHNLIGLTANTTYDFYVRTDCGGSGTSNWVGPFTFTTACNAFTVPFVENFNSTSTTQTCWTVINNNNDADAWNMDYTLNPLNGDEVAAMYTDINGGNNDDYLVTPTLTLTGNERLRFHYRVQSAGEPNDFQVTLSTTGVGVGNFTNTLMPLTTVSNTTYQEQIINLSAYSGNVNIAFHIPSGGLDGWRLYIDSVVVEAMPACPDPTALTATNITATTADLGWTDATGSLWDIEWGTTGFTPTGTPNITGTTTNPHNLTGLTAQTAYDFYVRTDCGGSGTSNWVGPFTFTTACASVMAPWNEDFENSGTIPSCWNQGTSNSESWIFDNTGGHVGNAGSFSVPTTSGNYFAYVDDSTPDNTGTTLESPYIDVSGLTVPELSFFLISNNEGNSNVNFSVDVWDGAAWNTGVYTSNTNTLNGDWEKIIVSLASLPITGDIQLRFIVDEPSNGDFYDDVAIDDVDIHEAPSCPDPIALTVDSITQTTVQLAWTEMGSATVWDIEWDTAGFTPGTGNMIVGTTTNPHNLAGLTANTSYEFYIRSICGPGDSSNWVGPYSFFTGYCQVVSTSSSSYMNDFSTTGGSTNISNLTSGYATNGYQDATAMVVSQFAGASFNFNTQFIGTTVGYNIWVDWNNDLDFDDPGEEVYASGSYVSSASGTITVPALTPVGNYRMRMRCDWNAISPNACGSSGSGRNETEDYTIAVVAQQANDIGVIAIESAPTGCGLGMETVTIKVKNYGTAAQSNFDVVYALNSVAITPETVTATVNPGDTLTHVFTTLANMSTPVVYTIDAWTDLTTDGDNNNDTLNGWMTEHLASSLAYNDSAYVSNTNAEGTNTIVCTNGLVNNMLDSCYTLSAVVIDSLPHTWEIDIDMWLISPAGDTLELSTDNGTGSGSDGYINVTFTDTASNSIAGATNLTNGFFTPEEVAGLAKFNGTDPNGAWTLRIIDDAGGDNGTLYAWHLEFTDHNFAVDLGADTNACSTDQITLNAGVTGSHSYSWSTGDNTQQITVDTNSLGGNGTYNISVVVTDTISGCQSIDTIVVNYSVCTGINAQVNNVDVNVYPNPNNGEFTLNVNTNDVNELAIKVVNIQGQEVYNKMNFDNINQVNEKIDLSDNADGIYFVIVTTDKGIVTHKMIVQ